MGKNIVLVGLMGAGKTSVGLLLSKKLDLDFIDTDELIEKQENSSISDIFKQKGEAEFRKIEKNLILKISEYSDKIVSTGGGTIENEDNIRNLKENGFLVYLSAPVDILFDRVKYQTTRPLLQNEDPRGTLQKLLDKREPFYKKADIIINTENMSINDITERIVRVYYETCKC